MTTVGIEDLQPTSDRDLRPGEVDYRRFEGNVAFTPGVVPAESGDPVNTGLGMGHGPARHWSRCLLIPALAPKGREAGMTTVGIEDLQSNSDRDLGPGEVDRCRRFQARADWW